MSLWSGKESTSSIRLDHDVAFANSMGLLAQPDDRHQLATCTLAVGVFYEGTALTMAKNLLFASLVT